MNGSARLREGALAVVTLSLILAFALLPNTALAIAGAEYPTVMKGSRGADVVGLQYLLQHHGYGVSVDGVFGGGTESAVEDFQDDNSLTVDGIVGPGTWAVLKVTLSQGSNGNAVRALQSLLNAKRDPDSPAWSYTAVDGNFGPGTKYVVQQFQTHAGLSSDGIAGTNTWKNLLWHFTRLEDSNPDICIFPSTWPESKTWGVGSATAWTMKAADLNDSSGYGDGDIAYQDSSWEHGLTLYPHLSHKVGMDLDVELARTNADQCTQPTSGYTSYLDAAYDQDATERQLNYFFDAASEDVVGDAQWIKLVWFHDPDIASAYTKVFRDADHDDHFHVRYCTAYYPGNAAYDC